MVKLTGRLRWLALGLIAVAILGVALWIASPWASRTQTRTPSKTSATSVNLRAQPIIPAASESSPMVTMARAAFDACGAPAAPSDVLDGATATREQMVGAHATVKAFDEATTIYNQCVDTSAYQAAVQFKAVATRADTEALNTLQIQLHNAAIDRDQAVASRFNVQLRRFKARGAK